MAEAWMKVEEATPDKPEIAILARRLGVSLGDAFLSWFKLYRWAGRVTADGFVRVLSGSDADQLSGALPGTADALGSAAVGWLELRSDGLRFINWDKHNSKSAKARALDASSKRKKREDVPVMSGCEPDKTRDRQEEDKRENQLLISNRKAIGSSPAAPPGQLRRVNFKREGFEADLSEVDWDRVIVQAEIVGRKIRPLSENDRRNWMRFAVLAQTAFSEAWLMDAVDAVLSASQTKSTKQAHLYGVLRAKAEEEHGSNTFADYLACIEIPTHVWKASVLEI
jgi:hypothetical protein